MKMIYESTYLPIFSLTFLKNLAIIQTPGGLGNIAGIWIIIVEKIQIVSMNWISTNMHNINFSGIEFLHDNDFCLLF